MLKKQIAILGSTGSIGTQTLDVIERNPDRFEVYALTANNNVELLVSQALKYKPEFVVIGNPAHYQTLKDALRNEPVKVFAGNDSIAQVAEMTPIDIVVTAMVGYSGLLPTIRAVKAGKRIALANKETLVVAGELINALVAESHAEILPVDSEHSAVFQCLAGENIESVEKLILTASGGPFRTKTLTELQKVSSQEALKHPNWEMGAKITIDSASMMNKGFEVIEAKWLFGLPPEKIDVVVHPQSIVHSMVMFDDSSIKAQMGLPDMRLPIQYALGFPNRIASDFERLDFSKYSNLTFEKPDTVRFRNLHLAFEAMKRGGNMPCVLNAANEIVNCAFRENKIGFLQMSDIIEAVMQRATFIQSPTYEDYEATDSQVRNLTKSLIK
ncbi:MAG: 1-deoxy-D-xylulose-5-phosphate reductoisomerase [Prevotellaceae bacterium]|nr:1-deoxy-D-xylulose-5-phosphate reductoisomerase [Prevotellaceae bacterium]